MPRNVEIKARLGELAAIRRAIERIADGPAQILDQEDIFFRIASGRLKLRILGPGHGELILYHRADSAGPKTSEYRVAPTSDPAALRAILAAILPTLGVVIKRRWLYLVGQTRVHLDQVEGLGEFVELEVVLRADQDEVEGASIARALMDRLGITQQQLVDKAYVDLLAL
jgi:predicted adenylyl cyclase CyaB